MQLYCPRYLFTERPSVNSFTRMTMELSRNLFVLCLFVTISSSVGNSVEATQIPRVIAVTSGPYEAGIAGTSFSCLVSEREENSTPEIKRYVRQGADVHTYSLDLPHGHATHTISDQIQTIFLPVNSQAQGTYTCRIFKNGQNHDVPITLLQADRRFEAQDGRPTLTVNAGERAILICEKLTSVLLTEIVWITLSDFSTVKISGTSLLIHSTSVSDADVYGCHVNGLLSQARLGVIRLIVRACSSGKWNPPACHGICDMCYNGGICDDKTGECVCPPGFAGRNCLNICAVDYFGWDCEFQCGVGQPLPLCAGSHICMPDPYGCSCVAGFTGTSCMDVCHTGMFGAGCTQTCHCAAGDCFPHSGECMHAHAGCASGWSGQNCQIPDHCPAGYFGEACTDKCHCENDHSCERETGLCPEGKCAPGFISSTGVNLANCQQFVGCISQCTRTCHCSDGEADCITDSGHHSETDGMCVSGMCASQWVGPNCQSGIIEQTSSRVNPGQPFQVSCAIINLSMMPVDVRSAAFLRQGSPNNASSFTIYISTDKFYSLHGTHFGYGKQDYMVSGIYPQDQLFCVHETSDGMAVAEVTLHFYALPVLGLPPVLIGSGDTWIAVMWPAWNSSNGDVGEGPIVSYNVYLQKGNGEWALEVTVPHSEHVMEHMYNVTDLREGATYGIAVTVSRDGEGGEGERSSPITVTIGTTPPLPDETTTADTTTVFGNNTPSPATSINVGAIVFSVLCLVLVVLICILSIIVWRKRRNRRQLQKQFEISSYKAADGVILDDDGVTLDDRGIQSSAFQGGSEILIPSEEGSLDEPVTAKPVATVKPSVQMEVLRPVPVADFVEYFWSSLDRGHLIKQWEALPEDLTRPCEVAKKENHKSRNRYRNILPYDHNRVVLKNGDDTEDGYINASYIKGDNGNQLYIASQDDHNRVVLKDGDDTEDGYINASYIKGDNGNELYIASQGPNTDSVNDFWRMIWQEDVGKIVMATNLIEEGKNKCCKYWPEVTEGEATFGSVLVETNSEDVLDCCVIRYFTVRLGEDRRRVVQFHYIKWPDKTVPRDTSSVMRLLDTIKDTPTQATGPTVVHCSASYIKGDNGNQLYIASQDDHNRVVLKNGDDTEDGYINASYIKGDNGNQLYIASQDDHNRVVLKDGDDTEDGYINASYIKGDNGNELYIASQGPNTDSVNDFWRMIWQEDVGKIVMATNLIEEGKNKCCKYWPEVTEGEATFGSVLVETNSEDVLDCCVIRYFTVRLGEDRRRVVQFHYIKWPNKTVPRDTSSVMRLLDTIKDTPTQATGPTVVHCSASYIKGDNGNQLYIASQDDHNRVVLKDGDDTEDGYINASYIKGDNGNQLYIASQDDHNRVVLKDGDDTEDGYINASYIKGDNGNELYIASQGPNTDSVNDFWRMIWQEDVGKIVMATNLIEEGKNKCCKYWPEVTEGEATFGSVLVETNSEDVLDCCVIRYFTVRLGEDRRRVVQFHYIKWPDKTVPRDTSSVMRLLDTIKDTPTQATGPTVVHCSASYIKGDNGNQLYIASQGPNTDSVNDFWRMIWQEDVGKIVMATNLIEEGKNKCYKYWPEVTEGEATFGSILVETNSEDVLDCCVIRYFTVRLGEDRRRVVQFHYIKWPDKTVPRDTSSVMRLLDTIKDTPTQATGPTVVHCSAGAGRSGVLLAFEIQKQRIEITNEVDIFNCVQEMRTERPWMVQTADQYVFLHRLIMEFLLCKNTYIEKDVFSTYACKIQESNPETGEAELTSQFKILSRILPALRVDPEAAGLQPENQNKNRDSDIVPVNRYRPYLITEVDASDSTNYINASFIDGISSTSEFVTTQMPLPHTIIDFWRLVHDYQVQTIVLLNSMDKRDETCQPYWGLGEPLVCGDLFRITTTAVTKKGDIVERTLVLENLVTQTISEIKQFQLKKWPNLETRPPSMSRLAIFTQLVKEYVAEGELTGPILVHCMSGVARSGIFCAVLSCLRQLDDYGGVDVLQTIKQLKQCQPLLIQSELEFCLVYGIISLCTSPEMCLEEEDGGRRREEGESMYENAGHSSSEMLDSESVYENLGFKSKSLRHSGIMQMDSNA